MLPTVDPLVLESALERDVFSKPPPESVIILFLRRTKPTDPFAPPPTAIPDDPLPLHDTFVSHHFSPQIRLWMYISGSALDCEPELIAIRPLVMAQSPLGVKLPLQSVKTVL